MKLSKYCFLNEKKWSDLENKNAKSLIDYINQNIDIDLYKMANTKDALDVYDYAYSK